MTNNELKTIIAKEGIRLQNCYLKASDKKDLVNLKIDTLEYLQFERVMRSCYNMQRGLEFVYKLLDETPQGEESEEFDNIINFGTMPTFLKETA